MQTDNADQIDHILDEIDFDEMDIDLRLGLEKELELFRERWLP